MANQRTYTAQAIEEYLSHVCQPNGIPNQGHPQDAAAPAQPFRSISAILWLISEVELVSEETIGLAVIYVHRAALASNPGGERNPAALFAAALALANKYLDDSPYGNLTFAHLLGVQVGDFAPLELDLLHLLEYRLFCGHRKIQHIVSFFSAEGNRRYLLTQVNDTRLDMGYDLSIESTLTSPQPYLESNHVINSLFQSISM